MQDVEAVEVVVAALPALPVLADSVDVDMPVDRVGMVFFQTGAHDVPAPGDTVREAVEELPAAPGEHQRLTGHSRRVVPAGTRAHADAGSGRMSVRTAGTGGA
jgi:hypothetical protein